MSLKPSIALTADVTAKTLLRQAVKPRHSDGYGATILASGTFGSGTISIFLSPDNGTTFIPAQKSDGTALTFTAAGANNLTLYVGNSARDAGIGIYYTFTGSTSASAKLWCSDNKG